VTVDLEKTRGVMNQLLYPIDGAPDLSDATAARMVSTMIDGRLFRTPVAVFAAAIGHVLEAGALHPQTAGMSRRHTEAELLDYLRRVAHQLEERKPWPPPLLTKLDVSQWPTFGNATVIARIDRPMHAVKGAIREQFDEVPTADGNLRVVILQLRTGEVVALLGSTSFVLLHRGSGDPAEVLAHFREATTFRPEDISPA
jgi:hypothetical protein